MYLSVPHLNHFIQLRGEVFAARNRYMFNQNKKEGKKNNQKYIFMQSSILCPERLPFR